MYIKKFKKLNEDNSYTRDLESDRRIREYTLLEISAGDKEYFFGETMTLLIFEEEESAKNYIFNEINDYVSKYEKDINNEVTEGISQYEDGYIFNNYNDALDWADSDDYYQDRVGRYNIETVYLYSKEDIEPKYKIAIDSNTYNPKFFKKNSQKIF